MVGDGPDLALAIGLARTLGVADDVQFLGEQDQLAALFPKLAGASLLVIALSLAANFYFIEDDSAANVREDLRLGYRLA